MKLDDKTLVILAATVIALVSMFILSDPEQVVGNIVTGLFGIAVGKSLL